MLASRRVQENPGRYGAGWTTTLPVMVTAVWASSLPVIEVPAPNVTAVAVNTTPSR